MRKHIPISKFVVGLVLGALLFWGSVAVAQQTPTVTTMQNAATATGNGTPLSVAGPAANPANVIGAAGVQVTGTFSGTVTFETTTNGSTWTSVMATNLADDTRATTTTAPGQFTIILGSAVQVRARVSAYTSGSITVVGRVVPGLVARVSSSGGGGGSGTVTSVAQSFTGGLISVSGSPVTSSGTLALTVAGTSGGVPYFSSSSTWASSAALAANALVIGGGAGAAPSTTTTGTGVLTALGVNTGSTGAFVLFDGAGGTPSSITLTNGSNLPLSTGVTGILPAANGGAGTINGILKANGLGTVSAAVAGTDYLSVTAPGSAGQLIYNNAGAYGAVSGSAASASGQVTFGGTIASDSYTKNVDIATGTTATEPTKPPVALFIEQYYAPTSNTSTYSYGANIFAGIHSSNTHNTPGVHGLLAGVGIDGAGNHTDVNALEYSIYHSGAGTVTTGAGSRSYVGNFGAGTIVDASAYVSEFSSIYDGNITRFHGLLVRDVDKFGGTIGTQYGVRILAQTQGSTNYNLSSEGATALNRIEGITEIGASLRTVTAAGASVGTATLPFKYVYLAGDSLTPGTNNFKLTGTATAARTITLPDASDTLVGKATTDTLTNKTLTSPTITTPAITTSAIVTRDGLGTTNATGVELINNTAAAAGAQQQSPDFVQTAQGWKTTATAASQTVNFRQYVLPVQGTTNPSANLAFQSQINGGGYTDRLFIKSDGLIALAGTTSSFPAWKRSSAGIEARLADDSGQTFILTSDLRIVSANDRFYSAGTGIIQVDTFGNARYRFDAADFTMGSNGSVTFTNTANSAAATKDTGVARQAAAAIRITNGSTGAGSLVLGTSTVGSIGTSGVGVLAIANGTAPTSSPADEFQLYAADSAAGASNAFIRNELGEVNRISGLSARNSAQFDKTTDATLANITGLSRNVEAGRTYAFRAVLQSTAAISGGVQFAVSGTATATAISYEGVLTDSATTITQTRATALDTVVCSSATSGAGTCTINGVIQVNAAGTLTIQFAQNTSNGTPSSVLANQYLQLIPIS